MKSISKFFQEDLGANLANERWSWGAQNPVTNQIFLRVWLDQVEVQGDVERVLVLGKAWRTSRLGHRERLRHLDDIGGGAEGFGVVCEARHPEVKDTRTIKSYDKKQLLVFGDLLHESDHVYATILGRVSVEQIAQQKTSHSTLLQDLRGILKKPLTTAAERIANARVGQGFFRQQVMHLWNHRCAVTGVMTGPVIRASHIKPWSKSSDVERLDQYNGLPLSATYDALFDCGLITFSDQGEMLVSAMMSETDIDLLDLRGKNLIKPLPDQTKRYLQYHREAVYRSAQQT